MTYKYRYLHELLKTRPNEFRAILITGPRRSGKSTLCRKLLEDWKGSSYVSFDTPLEQSRFIQDPMGFLRSLSAPVVFDEVQNVPEIFNYLKVVIDEKPNAGCDFILTGSQQFQMMNKVSESLAGRIMIKELLPFSLGEVFSSDLKRVKNNFDAILNQDNNIILNTNITKQQALNYVAKGGYPSVVLSNSLEGQEAWFNSYIETYIQRDVRALSNVQNLAIFSRFVTLLAGKTAQRINASELGKDISVNYKTAQHYLSLLEASYLWKTLPPYYKVGSEKRLSKSPKGIFLDSGLAMYMIGLNGQNIENNPLCGRMFETMVISEFYKLAAAFAKRIAILHYRESEASEVDMVIEYGNKIIPIEIKCSASLDSSWGKGIRSLRTTAKLSFDDLGFVISLHPKLEFITKSILNIPLSAFI